MHFDRMLQVMRQVLTNHSALRLISRLYQNKVVYGLMQIVETSKNISGLFSIGKIKHFFFLYLATNLEMAEMSLKSELFEC